jgi:hypothetical protein
MSRYRCSCGFAIDDPDESGDHYRLAFARDDDIGTDGRVHAELTGDHARATGCYPDTVPRYVCACGFAADDTPQFDDHLLIAFITPDGTGTDGDKHAPMEPSMPERWYMAGDHR